MVLKIVVLIAVVGLVPAGLSAQSKAEYKMSVVVAEDTTWGRAAKRFADALRHRTQARINVTNYFDGKLFADQHHSTVLYAVEKVERMRESDLDFDRTIRQLEDLLESP